MSNIGRPNLFSYATGELSQDAFLCWLLDWANPQYRTVDADLHACAVDFVWQLMEKEYRGPRFDILEVWPERQWNRIDVCAEIKGEKHRYLLIIEDKVIILP